MRTNIGGNYCMSVMIIGIAGGTGSGKSTFTNRLRDAFPNDVAVVYHDNYYRRQDDVPFEERKKVNYDHPASLETDLMIKHLKMLKKVRLLTAPSTITAHTIVLRKLFILSRKRSSLQKEFSFWQIHCSAA